MKRLREDGGLEGGGPPAKAHPLSGYFFKAWYRREEAHQKLHSIQEVKLRYNEGGT